jgi:hypothetical protein
MITVKNVLLHRSANTVIAKQVWPWELPVLEAQFGEGRISIREDSEVDRELPDAESEFVRLGVAYGIGSRGMTHAEEAYGPGKRGVAALRKEILSSAAKAPAVAKAKKVKAEDEESKVPADG